MSVSHNHQIIFVLGAPGSGKLAQCTRYSQEYNYNYISLKEEISTHIKKYIMDINR